MQNICIALGYGINRIQALRLFWHFILRCFKMLYIKSQHMGNYVKFLRNRMYLECLSTKFQVHSHGNFWFVYKALQCTLRNCSYEQQNSCINSMKSSILEMILGLRNIIRLSVNLFWISMNSNLNQNWKPLFDTVL